MEALRELAVHWAQLRQEPVPNDVAEAVSAKLGRPVSARNMRRKEYRAIWERPMEDAPPPPSVAEKALARLSEHQLRSMHKRLTRQLVRLDLEFAGTVAAMDLPPMQYHGPSSSAD